MAASSDGITSIARFISQGAIVQEFCIGHRNIVLNFPAASTYADHNSSYFGETIGRVANRVKGAAVCNLNGKECALEANSGQHSLHGGRSGWGKKIFAGPVSRRRGRDGRPSIEYSYKSPHGDGGYPGEVDVTVVYTVYGEIADGVESYVLEIEYEVRMAENQPDGITETIVNMTNHSYFNIAHGPTIEGTVATLSTDLHMPLDSDGIPTGEAPKRLESIKANRDFTLGALQPRIDDCFVLDSDPDNVPLDTRHLPISKAATFYHPVTDLQLEVSTTEPAFQFYTGDYIDVPAVDGAPARMSRAGFCVEPCRYVNAANVDQWRNMVLLKKGDVYGSRIAFRAWHGS
ncbi:MAG: hypothetical protein M1825_005673 [Sarcosagium campestre]|nr:MAG: hypothetical protein M1825_005673 [Sarcosagium campestre]